MSKFEFNMLYLTVLAGIFMMLANNFVLHTLFFISAMCTGVLGLVSCIKGFWEGMRNE